MLYEEVTAANEHQVAGSPSLRPLRPVARRTSQTPAYNTHIRIVTLRDFACRGAPCRVPPVPTPAWLPNLSTHSPYPCKLAVELFSTYIIATSSLAPPLAIGIFSASAREILERVSPQRRATIEMDALALENFDASAYRSQSACISRTRNNCTPRGSLSGDETSNVLNCVRMMRGFIVRRRQVIMRR